MSCRILKIHHLRIHHLRKIVLVTQVMKLKFKALLNKLSRNLNNHWKNIKMSRKLRWLNNRLKISSFPRNRKKIKKRNYRNLEEILKKMKDKSLNLKVLKAQEAVNSQEALNAQEALNVQEVALMNKKRSVMFI